MARLLVGTGRTITRMGEAPHFAEGLYELAPDTHAWMVPNGSWGETNLGLVRCSTRSVLIDTCWDLHFTQEMLRHSELIVQQAPIGRIINTHADGDHCWGNQLFPEQPSIATKACADHMHEHTPLQMTSMQLGAKLLRHVPMAGIDSLGCYMDEMLRPYTFRGIEVRSPSETFSGETSFEVEGVAFRLIEVGPAHTDGDCLVHLPERSVAYIGDVLFAGLTPVAWAGPVANIVAALRKVLSLNAEVIVPGHGPLASAADIQAQIDYWDWLQNMLEPMARDGMSPFEAARRCLNDQSFSSSIFAQWAASERLFTSACTIYRHWGLMPETLPGVLGVLNHFRQQALLSPLRGKWTSTRQ